MRCTMFILIVFIFTVDLYGQQNEDLTKYQDTVFIKHNKDWTIDKLNYITDTVIFETGMRRHILTGTAILPWTMNQEVAKGYGLYFNKVSRSNCQKDEYEYSGVIEDSIYSINTTDTSLAINISIYENCCYDFLCDISVDSMGILNLIYLGYGTYCFCNCCFGLDYHLSVLKYKDNLEIKAVMINGNRKTLKQLKK